MSEPVNRRRRRTPAEAEREILDAAERFLRKRPLREFTIDEVMAGTGLSRPAFYVYFKDRHDLVLRMVQEISGDLFDVADRWLEGTGDPIEDVREAIEGVVAAYARHGYVMRALSDGASDDPGVERAYRGLVQSFVDATAERIRRDTRDGRIDGMHPGRTAAALVWLNERYLTETLGRAPQARPRDVVTTLCNIWVRTLYPSSD